MSREYELILPGSLTDEDHSVAYQTLHEDIDRRIDRNEWLLSKLEIKDLPEQLTAGVAMAKDWLVRIHNESGLPISHDDIPNPAFIPYKDRMKLQFAMRLLGEKVNVDGIYALADPMYGRPFVFVDESQFAIDLVATAAHELYHNTSAHILTKRKHGKVFAARTGYWVVRDHPVHKDSWFLDEGFVESEATAFREQLLQHPLFADDAEALRTAMENKMLTGEFDENEMMFRDGAVIPARYCHAISYGKNGSRQIFINNAGLSTYAALAVDLIVSGFGPYEEDNMRRLLRRGRFDLSLIPDIARRIDDRWGKGTYTSLLFCPYTDQDAWKFVERLYDAGAMLPIKFSW